MRIPRFGVVLVATAALAALVASATMLATADAPGSQAEGIAVHGHWDLTIRNADGSVARQLAFENSLTQEGQGALVRTFGQTGRVGAWGIFLGTADTFDYLNPCGDDTTPQRCFIDVPTVEAHFAGTAAGDTDYIAISGQATATRDGNIGLVQTLVQTAACDLSQSLDSCVVNDYSPFTEKAVADDAGAMLAVTQGQIIQVRVEISFS